MGEYSESVVSKPEPTNGEGGSDNEETEGINNQTKTEE